MRNKIIRNIYTMSLLVVCLGCSKDFDAKYLEDQLRDHEQRLQNIEAQVASLNTQINSIQATLTAIEKKLTITSVETITTSPGGYKITFSDGKVATIMNGIDGTSGTAPTIGVDSEGYWLINGDRITANGQEIKAVGKDGADGDKGDDGLTPIMGVDADGYWTVTVGEQTERIKDENGKDVKARGEDGTSGNSFFKNVTQDDSYVYFTFPDNKTAIIAKNYTLTFEVTGLNDVENFDFEETKRYSVKAGKIAKISIIKPMGWKVSVEGDQLYITSPDYDAVSELDGEIAIIAFGENGANKIITTNVITEEFNIDFPDQNLKKYLLTYFDENNDREISNREAKCAESRNQTHVNLSDRGITNLEGIQYFSNIAFLDFSGNSTPIINIDEKWRIDTLRSWTNKSLVSLNVENAEHIKYLVIHNSQLTKLDIKNGKNLEYISCQSANLESFHVENGFRLKYLNCSFNSLSDINISEYPCLEEVSLAWCPLSNLDLSQNQNLISLNLGETNMGSIDVSQNTQLEFLWCKGTFSTIDLSQNRKLNDIILESNNIQTLDLSNCAQTFSRIDVDECANLSSLYLKTGQIVKELKKGDHTIVYYK